MLKQIEKYAYQFHYHALYEKPSNKRIEKIPFRALGIALVNLFGISVAVIIKSVELISIAILNHTRSSKLIYHKYILSQSKSQDAKKTLFK